MLLLNSSTEDQRGRCFQTRRMGGGHLPSLAELG